MSPSMTEKDERGVLLATIAILLHSVEKPLKPGERGLFQPQPTQLRGRSRNEHLGFTL